MQNVRVRVLQVYTILAGSGVCSKCCFLYDSTAQSAGSLYIMQKAARDVKLTAALVHISIYSVTSTVLGLLSLSSK